MKLEGAGMRELNDHELEQARRFMEEVMRLMAVAPDKPFVDVVRPAWTQFVRTLFQDQVIPPDHSLSLAAFECLYLESCRQAIDPHPAS